MPNPILPPGLTPVDFADALEALRRIVGKDYLYTGEALASYVDPYSIVADPDAHAIPAAVAPESADQVQAILKVANRYLIPLWPISCGKNHGYGGAAPRMPGTVVLDLNRMNRILEINVESGYALVEPGVSYFDLYRHLQEKGIKLWLDVPDPGWGSIVGNAVNWVGGGGHIGFSPVSPIKGDEALKQYRMVRDRLHQYGFDYMSVFAIGWREMHHVIELVFDRRDAETRRRAYEVFGLLVREAAEAGYGEYRTHISFMDQIAKTYGWNDNAMMKLNNVLKDALDPNGILAPGKQGIWPHRFRKG